MTDIKEIEGIVVGQNLVAVPKTAKTIKGMAEGENTSAVTVLACTIMLGLGCIGAYDAWQQTAEVPKTIGAFVYPVVWLALLRRWK